MARTAECEVLRLAPGESRQFDEKGDAIPDGHYIRRLRLRKRQRGPKKNIRFGRNGPEDELYVRPD